MFGRDGLNGHLEQSPRCHQDTHDNSTNNQNLQYYIDKHKCNGNNDNNIDSTNLHVVFKYKITQELILFELYLNLTQETETIK